MGQGVEIVEASPSGLKFILNKSPANGDLIKEVQCSSHEEIDTTIAQLRNQQKSWKSISLDERTRLVRNALSFFEKKDTKAELQNLISLEMGKTLSEAMEEVDEIADLKDEMLDLVREANAPEEVENAVIVCDPLGLVCVISPWNYPAGEIMLQAIPALIAGNAVLVKPSEVTPLTGEFVVNALSCANNNEPSTHTIPIALATGGGEVGEYIVSHPDVNMIAMTGSSSTGKKIMQSCSRDLKRIVLELGGKDPMVVFQDADLELAAKDAVAYSTCNAGQVCCSIERIYVDSSVKDHFEKLCVRECQGVKAGPFYDVESTIGPMVSQTQRDVVALQVEGAISQGAKLLYTGDIIAPQEQFVSGNYYPATVLTDLTQDMDISKTETFGPVVAIYPFDGSEEKAIQLANDTEYGLTASVYTKDVDKGRRVASGISAGQIAINAWAIAVAPIKCPWIGHKGSGFGYHSGKEGYKQFSVPKSIVFPKKNEE